MATMEIKPILSALARNKTGAVLIMLQMALTLAIVCNGLFIIRERIQRMERPSGIDEHNIAIVNNLWYGTPDDLKARVQRDLAALRALPGVVDVYATRNVPLSGTGWGTNIDLAPDQKNSTAATGVYFVDDHAQQALGVQLSAGRWFAASEIGERSPESRGASPIIIVTRALAEKLFPSGDAVGKSVYMNNAATTIVGVVDRLQDAWSSDSDPQIEYSVLMPYLWESRATLYVMRAQPGQRDTVLRTAQKALMNTDHLRLFGAHQTRTFDDVRTEAYSGDRALALILTAVCTLLVTVTGLGIVGLTSYWVTQRRRQIGIRRALGARRADILRYFHTENLLIATSACALGIALAVGINLWTVSSFEMARMGLPFVLAGAAIVLLIGQCAVLWPALRAASIPPAIAVRAA
jgi:putative ABC transport system permease protein